MTATRIKAPGRKFLLVAGMWHLIGLGLMAIAL